MEGVPGDGGAGDSPRLSVDVDSVEEEDFFSHIAELEDYESLSSSLPPSQPQSQPHTPSTLPQPPARGTPNTITPEDNNNDDEEDNNQFSDISSVPGRKTFVWGTSVSVLASFGRFLKFFRHFEKPGVCGPYFPPLFRQMRETETVSLNLDCSFLKTFDVDLYTQLLNYPREVLTILDGAATEAWRLYNELDETQTMPIQVRPFNIDTTKHIRDLNPTDIDKMIMISGMIIRTSPIVPDLSVAFFKCHLCNYEDTSAVNQNFLKEPGVCGGCTARGTMVCIHNRSTFVDKQYIKLQETVDSIPEGETPHTITLRVHENLVDTSKPGDKVYVTGIYRAQPFRVSKKTRTTLQIFKTYIDCLHFKKATDKQLRTDSADDNPFVTQDYEELQILESERERRKEEVLELSRCPDIYNKLVNSFAPSIWALEDVKKGILCQLFGGSNKQFTDKNTGRFRSEINTLLVGDPGTSKSQLLQYVHKLSPRGIYTSGKGSSAVGLTAYVTKDPDTGEAVLESGALVLSDKGICCIDEFDKMNDQTRSILHEVMEQQTVSVAKAGIICSLNARTSIIASANPRESKYNPRLSVVDNIQLPPTLLSRFDLIYLVLDKPDPRTDRKLAKHLVSLYYLERAQDVERVSIELLTDYISYAKKTCNPLITDEAAEKLVEGYVQMRRVGPSMVQAGRRTISATLRQLESLIRLSEALAKMELSQQVLEKHVNEATRLMRLAIQEAATDPTTGQIDMDLINTGRSARARQTFNQLYEVVKGLLDGFPSHSFRGDALFDKLIEQSAMQVSHHEVEEVLQRLQEDQIITVAGTNLRSLLITKLI